MSQYRELIAQPRSRNQEVFRLQRDVQSLSMLVGELESRVKALEARKKSGIDDLRERVDSFSLFENEREPTLGSDALLGIVNESEKRGRELQMTMLSEDGDVFEHRETENDLRREWAESQLDDESQADGYYPGGMG